MSARAYLTGPRTTPPVLTRDERDLLAAIHRWARSADTGSYWARWEPGLVIGAWKRLALDDKVERAEVAFGDCAGGQLHVEIRDGRWGECLLDERVTPRSVREAVDLLVVWGILPAEFSSLLTPAAPR